MPVMADVADGAAVTPAMEQSASQLGTPTLLVNSAWPTAIGSIVKVTQASLGTNPTEGQGSVVNISAVAGPIAGGTGNDPADLGWYPPRRPFT